MDALKITQRYHAAWLGVDSNRMVERDLFVAYSRQRDFPMEGYSKAFHLLAFKTQGGLVVSYGERAAPFAESLKKRLEPSMDTESLRCTLAETCGKSPAGGIKYLYSNRRPYRGGALRLGEGDAERYRQFFIAVHPNVSDISWVEEYFSEIVSRGFCFGVEGEDGQLLSVVDLPAMPFMRDEVQELGINTLSSHRGKGHAKRACLASVEAMLEKGVSPMVGGGKQCRIRCPSQKRRVCASCADIFHQPGLIGESCPEIYAVKHLGIANALKK